MGQSKIPTQRPDLGLPKSLGGAFETVKSEMESVQAQAPVAISTESITVSDTTQEISLSEYETKMTTSHASSLASLANGAIPGQRKLITLDTLGTAGDELALAATNIHNAAGTQATGVTFDAADEFLLAEWTGSEWQEIYGTATIATA